MAEVTPQNIWIPDQVGDSTDRDTVITWLAMTYYLPLHIFANFCYNSLCRFLERCGTTASHSEQTSETH